MSSAAGTSELARALNRDDVEQLRDAVAAYFDSWRAGRSPENDPSDLGREYALAFALISAASYDEAGFLTYVSAGPLEDCLRDGTDLSEEFVSRVAAEARRTPRFRWMLSGVWGVSPRFAALVKDAVAGVNCDHDPLPERPWA